MHAPETIAGKVLTAFRLTLIAACSGGGTTDSTTAPTTAVPGAPVLNGIKFEPGTGGTNNTQNPNPYPVGIFSWAIVRVAPCCCGLLRKVVDLVHQTSQPVLRLVLSLWAISLSAPHARERAEVHKSLCLRSVMRNSDDQGRFVSEFWTPSLGFMRVCAVLS